MRKKYVIPVVMVAVILVGCTHLHEGHIDHIFQGVYPLFRDGQWGGSCWALEQHGDVALIVTAAHCVQGYHLFHVGPYRAYLVWMDAASDVALLTVRTKDRLYALSLAKPKLGEECWAVGCAPDEAGNPSLSAYYGRVSNVSHRTAYGDVLLANTGIIGGMSGGPLLNKHGQVIGMCHRMQTWGYPMDSSGLFVPSARVREARDSLFREHENPDS